MKYDVECFGENLKFYMKKRKMTCQSLAEKLFVEPGTVGNWRSNKNIPIADSLLGIAMILNVSLDELFMKR